MCLSVRLSGFALIAKSLDLKFGTHIKDHTEGAEAGFLGGLYSKSGRWSLYQGGLYFKMVFNQGSTVFVIT